MKRAENKGQGVRDLVQNGAKWALSRVALALALLVQTAFSPFAVAEENPYSPALTVNGRVISNYELKQRIIFFSLLQPDLDATSEARKSLIDDRLRQYAAEKLGVTVSPDEIAAGMEAFAARANLSAEEFLKALATRGVATETFRDFVQTGVLWRETVRARYLARTKVTEKDIDRAIARGLGSGGELKLLLSEIIVKTDGPTDALELATRIKGEVKSVAGFAGAARVHSSAPTARLGGVLDWAILSALPPQVAAAVADLEPGQTSEPIVIDGSVMLLFLRDRSSTTAETVGAMAVDYVQLPTAAVTDGMRAKLDRCEDLLAFGRDLPEEAELRMTQTEASLPGDLAAIIRVLDAGEATVIRTAAGQTSIVMLCARMPVSEFPPSRDDLRGQILNQKMGLRAQSYLEELRAEALIVEP